MRALALIALTAMAVACSSKDSDTDSGLVQQADKAFFQQADINKKSVGYWYAPIR